MGGDAGGGELAAHLWTDGTSDGGSAGGVARIGRGYAGYWKAGAGRKKDACAYGIRGRGFSRDDGGSSSAGYSDRAGCGESGDAFAIQSVDLAQRGMYFREGRGDHSRFRPRRRRAGFTA